MKVNAFFATTLTLMSAPVLAEIDFSSWDEDGDGAISTEEWNASMDDEGLFDVIDENGNGVLEVEEVDEGFIEYDLAWDLDASGHIERGEAELGLFNSYDGDGDEQLAEQEFRDFTAAVDGSGVLDQDV